MIKKTPTVKLPPEDFTKLERAGNLPKPNKQIPITVPLDLLIHYYVIHNIQPRAYVDSPAHRGDIMICSKSTPNDQPLDSYIEKPA